MQDASWIGAIFGALACWAALPTLLTILACIDIYRRREPWWWYPIVFFFPWFGTIAYFVMTRAPWRFATDIGASRDRRRRADARLRALDTQLSHWRGPAVLAEAGEELLVLGRQAEARERFLEAKGAGASAEDVNLGLAETHVALGAHAAAIPVLEELLLAQPDAGLGRARILLARCFEALDRGAQAEASWRLVLERRNEPEAQARLARLLLLRGAADEATSLAQAVIADAKLVGAGLRRRRRPWIDLSRQVVKGRAAKVPSQAQAGAMRRWAWIVGIAALLFLLGIVALALLVLRPLAREFADARAHATVHRGAALRVAALDVTRPWTRGDDSGSVVLDPGELDAWLHARREWDRLHAAHAADDGPGEPSVLDPLGVPMSELRGVQRLEREGAVSLAHALTESGLGPETFVQLAGIVEGRYLGRPEAVGCMVPRSHRLGWSSAWRNERLIGRRVGATSPLEGYAEMVRAQREIEPRTRALLDGKRSELEALDSTSLPSALLVIVGASNFAQYDAMSDE